MDDRTGLMPLIGTRCSHSYLLRLWQEDPGSPWRAMLRNVSTQQEHLFNNLGGLVAFLKGGMGETESINGGKDKNGASAST
jgi:hypothetical protein